MGTRVEMQTGQPGFLEYMLRLAREHHVSLANLDNPKFADYIRKFDALPFARKSDYIFRLLRGIVRRPLFTADSGIPLITRDTQFRIMRGTRIKLGVFVELKGTQIYVGSRGNSGDGTLSIGDRTVIGRAQLDVIAPLLIGEKCLIGDCRIMTSNFHEVIYRGRNTRRDAPVTIGDRVWVGAGAIILPGSNIGSDTIIGAGALVRGQIPDRAVVIKNQGHIIKSIDGWYP